MSEGIWQTADLIEIMNVAEVHAIFELEWF